MTTTSELMTEPNASAHACPHGWKPTPGKRGDYCRRGCRRATPAEHGLEDPLEVAPLAEDPLASAALTIGGFAVHPLANLLPPMTNTEHEDLKTDIQKNGVRVPVLLLGGRILDGRNRMRACLELGLACPTEEITGDPAGIVASLNLHRRHLQPDQIAATAELLRAAMPEHHMTLDTPRRIGKQAVEDAKTLGVSSATVERVRELKRKAPEKLKAVAEGRTSAVKALREVKKTMTPPTKTPTAVTSPAKPALDRAVLAMQRCADKKPLLRELRQALHRAQLLHQRHPRHRDALGAFYQCLGAAFVDASLARPLKKRSS